MKPDLRDRLRATIREVPDFPKPGILFRDLTPILLDPALTREVVEALWEPFAGEGIEAVAAIESRGFVFGAALAHARGLPLVLLRKPGKLPAEVFRESYALEYGSDALEMHRDALRGGQRVLVVDDLLATGGTAAAAGRLVRRAGAEVCGYAFVVELAGLKGRAAVEGGRIHVLLTYEGA
jgi:adenine phosphoribosyltransferase